MLLPPVFGCVLDRCCRITGFNQNKVSVQLLFIVLFFPFWQKPAKCLGLPTLLESLSKWGGEVVGGHDSEDSKGFFKLLARAKGSMSALVMLLFQASRPERWLKSESFYFFLVRLLTGLNVSHCVLSTNQFLI